MGRRISLHIDEQILQDLMRFTGGRRLRKQFAGRLTTSFDASEKRLSTGCQPFRERFSSTKSGLSSVAGSTQAPRVAE